MHNYELYYIITNKIVREFSAGSDEDALVKARQILRDAGMHPDQFQLREIRLVHGSLWLR